MILYLSILFFWLQLQASIFHFFKQNTAKIVEPTSQYYEKTQHNKLTVHI
jgi:hypothetical protein